LGNNIFVSGRYLSKKSVLVLFEKSYTISICQGEKRLIRLATGMEGVKGSAVAYEKGTATVTEPGMAVALEGGTVRATGRVQDGQVHPKSPSLTDRSLFLSVLFSGVWFGSRHC
jgi:hypothetical protein